MKEFMIINDKDGNDSFTVEAENENDVAYKALEQIGWRVVKGEETEETEETEDNDGNEQLTNEQKKRYLENSNYCLHCESENISAGNYDFDFNQCWSNVKCNSCGKTWTDIYTLTDVEPNN